MTFRLQSSAHKLHSVFPHRAVVVNTGTTTQDWRKLLGCFANLDSCGIYLISFTCTHLNKRYYIRWLHSQRM